jgi:hypothetical protein
MAYMIESPPVDVDPEWTSWSNPVRDRDGMGTNSTPFPNVAGKPDRVRNPGVSVLLPTRNGVQLSVEYKIV